MSTSPALTVMLVDDHAVVRAGIRRLLEQHPGLQVVAEADSGEQAYALYGEHLPDVTVMDLSLPGMGGIEAIQRIVARHPRARVLVLTMHENAIFAHQAFKAGARGYLPKSGLADELPSAIEAVARGRSYIAPGIAQSLALQAVEGVDDPFQALSNREFEVFRLLVSGQDVETVARLLRISGKTVSNYQTLIRQKLGASSPLELVRLAIRHGVIEG